jgi:S1-C subfamily serine protease
VGDVIATLDGVPAPGPEALRIALARKTPGSLVEVGLRRTGSMLKIQALIAELPDNM